MMPSHPLRFYTPAPDLYIAGFQDKGLLGSSDDEGPTEIDPTVAEDNSFDYWNEFSEFHQAKFNAANGFGCEIEDFNHSTGILQTRIEIEAPEYSTQMLQNAEFTENEAEKAEQNAVNLNAGLRRVRGVPPFSRDPAYLALNQYGKSQWRKAARQGACGKTYRRRRILLNGQPCFK
jgi:hypothetical protein